MNKDTIKKTGAGVLAGIVMASGAMVLNTQADERITIKGDTSGEKETIQVEVEKDVTELQTISINDLDDKIRYLNGTKAQLKKNLDEVNNQIAQLQSLKLKISTEIDKIK